MEGTAGRRQHDAFLLKALNKVQREIHIVSPWINKDRIQDIGAFKAMQEAVKRQVQVTVSHGSGFEHRRQERHKEDHCSAASRQGVRRGDYEVEFCRQSPQQAGDSEDDEVFCVGSFNWVQCR